MAALSTSHWLSRCQVGLRKDFLSKINFYQHLNFEFCHKLNLDFSDKMQDAAEFGANTNLNHICTKYIFFEFFADNILFNANERICFVSMNFLIVQKLKKKQKT